MPTAISQGLLSSHSEAQGALSGSSSTLPFKMGSSLLASKTVARVCRRPLRVRPPLPFGGGGSAHAGFCHRFLGLRPHLAPPLIRAFAEGHGQRSFPTIITVSQRRGQHKLEEPSDSILRSPTLALQTCQPNNYSPYMT